MSYASDSATDRLAAVRAAIDRCLTSQAYSVGNNGRMQRMAELRDLRAMEKELIDEVSASSQGASMASLGEFGRPV